MSVNKLFTILIGFVLLATATGLFELYKTKESSTRTPASDRKYRPVSFGKVHRAFDIQIYTDNELPSNNKSEVVLKAQVVMLNGSKHDLDYKWILPEGVSIVEGQVEDSWAGVTSGQVIETTLTVVGLSREQNQLVILNVSKEDGDRKIAASNVFATRPEDTLEYGARERMAAVDEIKMDTSEAKPEEKKDSKVEVKSINTLPVRRIIQ